MSGRSDISRRTFVLGTTATVVMSAAGAKGAQHGATAAGAPSGGAAAGSESDLCNLSAVEAVAHMSQGALTSERYAQALLARCQAAHGLNAFITLEPARVLEDARARDRERLAGAKPGPLFGLPIPVKDSVNTRDYPDHRRHAGAAPFSSRGGRAGGRRPACRRRHRARQDESARTLLRLDQQQSRLRRRA